MLCVSLLIFALLCEVSRLMSLCISVAWNDSRSSFSVWESEVIQPWHISTLVICSTAAKETLWENPEVREQDLYSELRLLNRARKWKTTWDIRYISCDVMCHSVTSKTVIEAPWIHMLKVTKEKEPFLSSKTNKMWTYYSMCLHQ